MSCRLRTVIQYPQQNYQDPYRVWYELLPKGFSCERPVILNAYGEATELQLNTNKIKRLCGVQSFQVQISVRFLGTASLRR
jgi:hypothetical protein